MLQEVGSEGQNRNRVTIGVGRWGSRVGRGIRRGQQHVSFHEWNREERSKYGGRRRWQDGRKRTKSDGTFKMDG